MLNVHDFLFRLRGITLMRDHYALTEANIDPFLPVSPPPTLIYPDRLKGLKRSVGIGHLTPPHPHPSNPAWTKVALLR